MMVPKSLRLGAAAAGALLVAGVAVAVTASAAGLGISPLAAVSPSPSPSAKPGAARKQQLSAYCDIFVGHLASDLGKSPDQVKKAVSDALSQTVDDAVKKGDLTQSQGEALKKRIDSNAVCSGQLAGLGLGRIAGEGELAMRQLLPAAAAALGISQSELQSDLAKGMTLHQIADSKHVSEAQFRDKLASQLQTTLDQAVKDGKLTQKQEDAILSRVKNGPLPLWDQPLPKRPGGMHRNGPAPSAPSSPGSPGTTSG